jgi:hypothetical protein
MRFRGPKALNDTPRRAAPAPCHFTMVVGNAGLKPGATASRRAAPAPRIDPTSPVCRAFLPAGNSGATGQIFAAAPDISSEAQGNGQHIARLYYGNATIAEAPNGDSQSEYKAGREGKFIKDVKYEGRSDYVYENTQTDD